jgi:hypothetical protein
MVWFIENPRPRRLEILSTAGLLPGTSLAEENPLRGKYLTSFRAKK